MILFNIIPQWQTIAQRLGLVLYLKHFLKYFIFYEFWSENEIVNPTESVPNYLTFHHIINECLMRFDMCNRFWQFSSEHRIVLKFIYFCSFRSIKTFNFQFRDSKLQSELNYILSYKLFKTFFNMLVQFSLQTFSFQYYFVILLYLSLNFGEKFSKNYSNVIRMRFIITANVLVFSKVFVT